MQAQFQTQAQFQYVAVGRRFVATLGKLLLGLRVVNVDGSRIGWGASIIRNLLRIIDALPFFYLFGAILICTAQGWR